LESHSILAAGSLGEVFQFFAACSLLEASPSSPHAVFEVGAREEGERELEPLLTTPPEALGASPCLEVRVTCRLDRLGAFACRIIKLSYEKILNLVANQSNISSEIKV
jgi:hypothetical protein